MRYLLMVGLLMIAGKTEARCPFGDCMPTGIKDSDESLIFIKEAEGRQRRSEPYNPDNLPPLPKETLLRQTLYWVVVKDTEAYTLREFISSGKLCEFRGKHEWTKQKWDKEWFASPMEDGCGGWADSPEARPDKCTLCGRCRKKIKVNKQVEQWEE